MDYMMDMDMATGTLDTRGLIEDYNHGAAGFADDEEQEKSGGFKVEDDDAADWCIRRIKEREAERDRLLAIGKKQIDAILAKMDAETEKCANDTNFLTAQLQSYFQRVPHKATKTQETYKLLSGSLVMKRGGFKTTVDDEALVPWLLSNGYTDKVKTFQKAAWGDLKKECTITEDGVILTETGEKLDGVAVEKAPDTFIVK